MDVQIDHKDLSDDEIFFGKLTLKEVKKHVMMDRYRHSLSCAKTKDEDSDSSLKIIEACSEPELVSGISLDNSHSSLLSSCDDKTTNSWDITTDNKSFLEMEQMVSNLLLTDNKEKEELDNTLDVVEYILNNAPHIEECHVNKVETENSEQNNCHQINVQDTKMDLKCTNSTPILSESDSVKYSSNIDRPTPVKEKGLLNNCGMSQKNTDSAKKSVNNMQQKNLHSTPSCKTQINVFKTPKNAVSIKKPMQTPSTSKLNAYQHITSPVATYIKNGPQVPLLKDVRPKKSLTNVSLIPKPFNNSKIKTNKENINLPSLAYKSAKNVKVIKVPDEKKLPENQWAKTLSSSLQKPIVIKHNHRENNGDEKKCEPAPEDSFANLTLYQADISVCTQKTAYHK